MSEDFSRKRRTPNAERRTLNAQYRIERRSEVGESGSCLWSLELGIWDFRPAVRDGLAHSEGFQGGLIEGGGGGETVGGLIRGQGFLGERADEAVHFALI
jgi:hypothetical protein